MRSLLLFLTILTVGFGSGSVKAKGDALLYFAPECPGINIDSVLTAIELEAAQGGYDLDTAPGGFFGVIYMTYKKNPGCYWPQVAPILKNGNLSENKQRLCIFFAQSLTDSEYAKFSLLCVDLFEQHRLSEDLMDDVLVPPAFTTDDRFAYNFDNKLYKPILKRLLSNKALSPEFRKTVNFIASGRMKASTEKMRRQGWKNE